MNDTKNRRGMSLGQLLNILAIAAAVCASSYYIYNNHEHAGRPAKIEKILSYQSEVDTIDNRTELENQTTVDDQTTPDNQTEVDNQTTPN